MSLMGEKIIYSIQCCMNIIETISVCSTALKSCLTKYSLQLVSFMEREKNKKRKCEK